MDLEALFDRCEEYWNSPHVIERQIAAREVVLYGAGCGLNTFAATVLQRFPLKVRVVLDQKFRAGDTWRGLPACPPDSYVPTADEKSDAIAIITVGKEHLHAGICETLKRLGYRRILLASEIYEYHVIAETERLREQGFAFYQEQRGAIQEAYAALADAESRDVFLAVLRTHMLRRPERIPAHPLAEQYFPDDVELARGISRFVNCGAYVGDTVRQMAARFGRISALACFEPDQSNFGQLSRYLAANRESIAREIVAFPCGLYDREVSLCFSDGGGSNSALSGGGGTVVQCVAMDHVLPAFRPTRISMDIEGAEAEALRGSAGLIAESAPDLAICVYHAPHHLWEVPLWVRAQRRGYRLYLRNYTGHVAETVLYATQ